MMAARKTRAKAAKGSSSSVVPAAIGAALVGAGALAVGWWLRNAKGGIFGTPLPEGHAAPDLALDAPAADGPDARPVPEHFRPDATSPIPAGERDNFAPAYAKPDVTIN